MGHPASGSGGGLTAIADQTALANTSGGSAVPVGTAGLPLLRLIMKGSSVRIDVVGAPVTNIDFAGLAGDTDGDYEGEFWCPSLLDQLVLQPQNLTTNQEFTGQKIQFGTGAVSSTFATFFLLADGITAGGTAGHWTLKSKSGQGNRRFTADFYDTDGASNYTWDLDGWWTDTATVLDKIRIHCNTAVGIPVGSWFTLRKLGKL